MVVTRKKPSAPAPPTSRTNSTQALPRAVNAKALHSNLSVTSTNDVPNGTSHPKHNTEPDKSKHKLLARRKKRSFMDRLFFLFLSTFAIYALYTCPFDSNNNNSVCRSLQTYNTHVLQPYVIPPIRAAISHPALVQPYETYAKPIYQNYIEPVTPYIAAAHTRTAPYVNSVIHLSQRAVSRVWNNVVTPYWTRAVVPRYILYVRPHVHKYVNPLIRRAKYYNGLAEPHVRTFAHHTSIYAHRAFKYALVAYDRSHTILKPYVLRGYAQLKPLVCQITRIVQSKGKYVAIQAISLSQVALGRVGDLRREFVDPHVLRIWEKAVEKSSTSSIAQPSPTVAATATPSSTPSELSDDIVAEPTDVEISTGEATIQPTAIAPSSSVQFTPPSSIVTDDVISTQDPVVPDAIPEETLEKAASVAQASAAHASNVIAGVEAEIKEAEASQVAIDSIPDLDEVSVPSSSDTHTHQADTPQVTATSQVEDLDDFLREIGLDEEEKVPEPEPAAEEEVPPPREEEDEEAKKAAVAAKRADIVGRHVRWQSELNSLVRDLTTRVSQDIQTIRKEAIAYIGRLPSDNDSSAPDGKGKEVLDKIQNEGEKLLKGLEVYVARLTRQTINHDEAEKEKEKWDKVVDKVDQKFGDVVRNLQEEVHNWYVQVREREISTVLLAGHEVKSLADTSQTDLGLDYAWLDDVTYEDWQKYHDLMRTYESFDKTARSLQNGTHPDAPQDTLIPALDQLDHEVKDLVSGFAVRMSSVASEADQWFDGIVQPVPEPEEEEEDEDCEEEEEPLVSILPISPEPAAEKVDPAVVVIGKSAEQMEKMAQEAVADQRIEL